MITSYIDMGSQNIPVWYLSGSDLYRTFSSIDRTSQYKLDALAHIFSLYWLEKGAISLATA